MAHHVYFEDVAIGDSIPEFSRKTDFMNWNRFAAVNDEFVYLHMDDEIGKLAGQGAAFGMGNLRYSYVLNALRTWTGDEAEVRELSMQFRSVNHKNDVLTTRGVVVDKCTVDGEHQIHLEIDVRNQRDESTSPGRAVVVVPSRED